MFEKNGGVMSREIKFEFVFQHIDSKEIKFKRFTLDEIANGFEDDLFILECDCEPIGETNVVECNCEDYLEDFRLIDKRQYTGVKDKNAKEIYEGDILQFTDYVGTGEYNSWDEEIMESFLNNKVVKFGNIGWENVGHWNCKGGYMAEIIGNIYENPELLS
jgi:uncharacterized phage protein (TIGR01671 family)